MKTRCWVADDVTLYDGRVVKSDSIEYLRQCEAMTILGFSDQSKIEFFALAETKRGADSVALLRKAMDKVEHVYVLDRLMSKERRVEYLTAVGLRRGMNARVYLERRIMKLWHSRQPVV